MKETNKQKGCHKNFFYIKSGSISLRKYGKIIMIKSKKPWCSICFLLLMLLILPPWNVYASSVVNFSDLYMDVTINENIIVLTKDTPSDDERWLQIGIFNPDNEKETMDDLGVQAIFYDIQKKSTIRLLAKTSNQSNSVFHLGELEENELNEFYNGFVSDIDENTYSTMEEYSREQVPFFRYYIEMLQDDQKIREVIYGTIVNGSTISYDIYTEDSTEIIDESFLKELVASTTFTEFLNKQDIIKEQKDGIRQTVITMAVVVVIAFLWFFLQKKKTKKRELILKQKNEQLTAFYMKEKQNEQDGNKVAPLYTNRTSYTLNLIKTYCTYNELIKNKTQLIILAIILVSILLILNLTTIYYIAIIFIGFLFFYLQNIRFEKLIKNLYRPYEKNGDAIFHFYEDYFTLSGIQSISKYPYSQIEDIKLYQNYIYIYVALDRALYLTMDGFEENKDDFMQFINEKTQK